MAEDRRQLLEQAERATRRGDFAAAAAAYRRLLALTPNDLVVIQRLGDVLARAGQPAEARATFRRLADEYWKGGHRPRAVAALRRASRIGSPDPKLLKQLGGWMIESGLAADAREPMLEAARLLEESNIRDANALYRELAEALPGDLTCREGLVRLREREGDGSHLARARTELALARVRNGDLAGMLRDFARALVDDPQQLAALERLPEAVREFARRSPVTDLPRAAGTMPSSSSAGWAIFRAAVLTRIGDGAAVKELEPLLADGSLPPRAFLWIGRVLLESGCTETAGRAIIGAAREMMANAACRGELIDALSALVSANPAEEEAARMLSHLSTRGAGAGSVVTRPQAVRRETDVAPDAGALPSEVQAQLLEAQSLLTHALPEAARAALDEVPAAYRGHPEVAELAGAIDRALARSRGPKTTAPLPGRAAAPPARPRPEPRDAAGEDDFVVVLDPDDAPASPPAARRPAPVPPDAAPPPPAARVHVSQTDVDAETEYEMAIGLLEMGMVDQSAELLQKLLATPARRGDAAVVLVRIHRERGDLDRAEAIARAACSAGEISPGVEAELVSVLASIAEAAGRPDEARSWLERLRVLLQAHPELAERSQN